MENKGLVFDTGALTLVIEGVSYTTLPGITLEDAEREIGVLGAAFSKINPGGENETLVDDLKASTKTCVDKLLGDGRFDMIFKSIPCNTYTLLQLIAYLADEVQKRGKGYITNLKNKYEFLKDV
jgi:hypothetical protein